MLNIFYGDMKEAVYNTAGYFKYDYEDEWIVDPFVKKMILDVDKSTVMDSGVIDSPVSGKIPPVGLSGGVKTLILVKFEKDKVFNASTCGDNCAKWLLEIAKVTDIFQISGTGFTIYLKCAIASANDGFCDGNPGIIVAEDSGIFLVPGRVGADLSKLQVISGIGRLQEHDAVFGIQMFLDRVQGFLRKPFLYANACEDAEALGFDKDLTFFTFPGADLVAVGIVGPEEPFPVPAGIQDCLIDCCNLLTGTDCLHSIAEKRDKLRVLFPIFNEHSGNKYGFCDRTLTWSKGLEGFAGLCGKTV